MERTYSHRLEEVFAQCKAVLQELNISIEYNNKSEGLIQATASGSILSWGEDIEIRLKTAGKNQTKVTVTSEANAQLFSWGKDSANERNILEKLSDKLR